jgi:hypothetical protein
VHLVVWLKALHKLVGTVGETALEKRPHCVIVSAKSTTRLGFVNRKRP